MSTSRELWRLRSVVPETITDDSGNGHTAANNGAELVADVPPEVNTVSNRSLEFDPVGDHLDAGDVADQTGSFSLCARVKMDDVTTGGQRIIFKDAGTGGGWALSVGDPGEGAVRFFVRSLNTISTDTPLNAVAAGTWHALVAVFDATNDRTRIYVDGTQVAEVTGQTNLPVDNTASLQVGTPTPDRTDGKIIDPRVYSRALTDAEATAYAAGEAVDSTNLSVHYSLAVDGIDTDVHDIHTTEAVNRYASHFIAQLDDPMGTKANEYPRGTRAVAEYSTDGGVTWQTKQAGFVNYLNDTGRDRTDQLEVLFIGYDHFLRRRPIFETFGEPGTAHLSFNATDGYIDVPGAAAPATNAITVSLWTTGGPSQPANDSILEADDANGNRVMNIHLPHGTGIVYWDFGDSPYDRISVDLSGMDWQSWHHWAFVVDSTEPRMAIYRDGERMAVDTTVGKALSTAPASFYIAANQSLGQFYDGTVEDVQIFTRDLSAAEITDLSQGIDVTTRLASRFKMDDGSGTTVTESVSGNHGTLTGTGYEWVTEPPAPPDEGPAISAALETIITENTPVNWNPANVDVVNDATFKREFQGEKADDAISYLASASGGEEYGVTDEFEFFFRPRETETAPSNVLNGDWFDYDLPQEGRRAVNQVRIFYGQAGNRSSVIVEDRVAQQRLQDKLGAPRRVVLSDEAAYPEIDNEAAAYAKGREILQGRSPARTGTVKTFQRYDWDPGDVFRLEIPPKGIDTTFRAAEIQHDWGRAETTLKVAENEGNITDLLVGMSDEIERIDFREADPDATFTRFLELELGVTVSISGTLDQRNLGDSAFLAGFGPTGDHAGFGNTGAGQPQPGFDYTFTSTPTGTGAATTAALNQFRDVWQGATATELTTVALGTGTTEPTQANTTLDTQVYSDAVTRVGASGAFSITFEAVVDPGGSLEGTSLTEFGFFDAAGDLHGRTVLDQGVTHTSNTRTTISMTFTIETDPDRQGVITETGQTILRDLYLDHTNAASSHPTDRAYGTGTTAEAETDTALATKLAEKPITAFNDRGVGQTDSVMRLETAEANGNALTELGDENAANELLSRVTFEAVDKTSAFALETNPTITVRPVIL